MASSFISHFFLRRQEKITKEGNPGLWLRRNLKVSLRRNKLLRSVLSPLSGALRCSTGQAAVELALRAQTFLAEIPCQPALLGGAQGMNSEK